MSPTDYLRRVSRSLGRPPEDEPKIKSLLPTPIVYDNRQFITVHARDLYQLMSDCQWHDKQEIRAHLSREEDRAAMRDLGQSGFVVKRRPKGGRLNEWQMVSTEQDLRLFRLRSAITSHMKEYVLRRDGRKCLLCGATGELARLTVDHRIPITRITDIGYARAPGWSLWFFAICKPCNDGKRQECLYCRRNTRSFRKDCLECHLAFPERHTFISARVPGHIVEGVRTLLRKKKVVLDALLVEALQSYLNHEH